MVNYEQEVCLFLRIPGIPKKEWNGKDAFKQGVAIVTSTQGDECYAVATYDPTRHTTPNIVKVFSPEPFTEIKSIWVVPSYMETPNTDEMDLDDESKKRAEALEKEAHAMENEGVGDDTLEMPDNEYFFDHIHNDEEGRAYIEAYNRANHIKAGLPKKHESIVMRLGVIWSEQNKKA